MPKPLDSSNGKTSGHPEGVANISSEDVYTLTSIGIHASLLPVKFLLKSPFQTDYAIVVALLVALQVYIFALIAKKRVVLKLEAYAEIINYYVHLCGLFLNVLLVMLLAPILGRIYFGIWVCCIIILTYLLLRRINATRVNVRNGDGLNRESNSEPNGNHDDPNKSTNEISNGDGSNQTPNESTDEETNRDNFSKGTFEISIVHQDSIIA